MTARRSTQVILFNILKCLMIFYSTYYVISSVCFACYRLKHFDGKIPFDFKMWLRLPNCCSQYSSEETVNFISMQLSFAISGVVFGCVVRQRIWDYSVTVTLFHTALSCLVMLNFPLNWSWWVCLAFAYLLMTVFGELVALILRLKCGGKVAPLDTEEQGNFLHTKS